MKSAIKRTIAAVGVTVALLAGTAVPANAYYWTQKYHASDGTYWAYKVCTREEWFNGCTPGWYTSWYHWSLWG